MADEQRRPRNSRGQFTEQSLPPAAPQGGRVSRRACRSSSSTAAVFSLLAGAGVGLAAMYLLDPEAGAERRRRLADRSHDWLESSKDLAHDAAQSAGSAAHSLGGQIAGKAAAVAELARDYASKYAVSQEAAMDMAKDKFAGLSTYASDTAGSLRHRANVALGREREHHYAGQTACAVGSLALGAGLFWMLDPRLGRSRRAWLRDKSMHWLNETGDMFRLTGQHIANRMRGTVAETRRYLRGSEQVDDAKLCARVRSELGRVIEDAHAVEVLAQDGHVTLRGTADGAEINSIANVVLGIRGVRGFDNQLRTPGNPATTTQSSTV